MIPYDVLRIERLALSAVALGATAGRACQTARRTHLVRTLLARCKNAVAATSLVDNLCQASIRMGQITSRSARQPPLLPVYNTPSSWSYIRPAGYSSHGRFIPSHTTCWLLELPPELRNYIWEFALIEPLPSSSRRLEALHQQMAPSTACTRSPKPQVGSAKRPCPSTSHGRGFSSGGKTRYHGPGLSHSVLSKHTSTRCANWRSSRAARSRWTSRSRESRFTPCGGSAAPRKPR